jgi:hypothetical protein
MYKDLLRAVSNFDPPNRPSNRHFASTYFAVLNHVAGPAPKIFLQSYLTTFQIRNEVCHSKIQSKVGFQLAILLLISSCICETSIFPVSLRSFLIHLLKN